MVDSAIKVPLETLGLIGAELAPDQAECGYRDTQEHGEQHDLKRRKSLAFGLVQRMPIKSRAFLKVAGSVRGVGRWRR